MVSRMPSFKRHILSFTSRYRFTPPIACSIRILMAEIARLRAFSDGVSSPPGGFFLGWKIELLVKELKGVVGVGQHQVTKKVDRVERSMAVAIMAYLLLLKLRAKDIPAERPWSAFRLQRAFAREIIQAQCERSARQMARKWFQMGKAA
jgi:hypothetical protein